MNRSTVLTAARIAVLALPIAALDAGRTPARAVVTADAPSACSDRNALQNVAVDSRLIAIKLYYEGYLHNISDRAKQTCLTTRVLLDDRFEVLNKTRGLVETQCMSLDDAAGAATEGLCP
jgi:hypothetical protein